MRRTKPLTDWETSRLGKMTASNVHKIFKTSRGGEGFGEVAKEYLLDVVIEHLTLTKKIEPETNAMLYGAATEIDAATALLDYFPDFEYFGGYDQRFFRYSDWAGGSPDGETEKAIVEIKCPYNTLHHVENMLIADFEQLKKERTEYYWQIVFNALIRKKEVGIFVSFDPEFILCPLYFIKEEIPAIDSEMLEERLVEAEEYIEELLQQLKPKLTINQ